MHAEQAAEGFDYVEVRLAPRRLVLDGLDLLTLLRYAHTVARPLGGPVIRLLLLLNRNDPAEFVEECEAAIAGGLPATFVGIDLAGDERGNTEVSKECRAAGRMPPVNLRNDPTP